MMDLFAKCYETFIQDEIRDMGLYPYFHALESRQDVTVTMEGARRIMLGSNNYLGLTVETISRLLGRFQKSGMLAVKGKYITIENNDALAQLAGHTRNVA